MGSFSKEIRLDFDRNCRLGRVVLDIKSLINRLKSILMLEDYTLDSGADNLSVTQANI